MVVEILLAISMFLITNIDDFILLMIYGVELDKHHKYKLYIAQAIALLLIIGISILGAFLIDLLPQNALSYIHYIGAVPILIGLIHVIEIFTGRKEKRHEKKKAKIDHHIQKPHFSITGVSAIIFLSGADNIGVYIPLFVAMTVTPLVITNAIFIVLMILICFLAILIAKSSKISKVLKHFDKFIVPAVLITIGLLIIFQVF